MQSGEEPEEEVTRTEVRPGLTMVRCRTRKADGRTLIYYEFERSGPVQGREKGPAR